MIKKLKNIREVCNYVGATSLLIYFVFCILDLRGDNSTFMLLQIFFASVALIANSVRLGIEISISIKKEETLLNKNLESAIFLIMLCIADIIIVAVQLT